MAASPLLLHAHDTIIMPPHLCGGIDYYAAMAAHGHAVIATGSRFDKRDKDTHRFAIADTRGPLTLTVPINKPQSATRARWTDITVSTHDSWWNIHLTSLESAYGRTPFFEFYIDRFKPLFSASNYLEGNYPLMNLNAAADAIIRQILGIETIVDYFPKEDNVIGSNEHTKSYRRIMSDRHIAAIPYYQVRAGKLGYISGLSVLDLIFNLGPEAPLMLQKTQQALGL